MSHSNTPHFPGQLKFILSQCVCVCERVTLAHLIHVTQRIHMNSQHLLLANFVLPLFRTNHQSTEHISNSFPPTSVTVLHLHSCSLSSDLIKRIAQSKREQEREREHFASLTPLRWISFECALRKRTNTHETFHWTQSHLSPLEKCLRECAGRAQNTQHKRGERDREHGNIWDLFTLCTASKGPIADGPDWDCKKSSDAAGWEGLKALPQMSLTLQWNCLPPLCHSLLYTCTSKCVLTLLFPPLYFVLVSRSIALKLSHAPLSISSLSSSPSPSPLSATRTTTNFKSNSSHLTSACKSNQIMSDEAKQIVRAKMDAIFKAGSNKISADRFKQIWHKYDDDGESPLRLIYFLFCHSSTGPSLSSSSSMSLGPCFTASLRQSNTFVWARHFLPIHRCGRWHLEHLQSTKRSLRSEIRCNFVSLPPCLPVTCRLL